MSYFDPARMGAQAAARPFGEGKTTLRGICATSEAAETDRPPGLRSGTIGLVPIRIRCLDWPNVTSDRDGRVAVKARC
jgi:hypothetical protein